MCYPFLKKMDFFSKKYIFERLFKCSPELFDQISIHNMQSFLLGDYSAVNTLILESGEKIAKMHLETKKPLSKIFKEKFFYERWFFCDENVLCPRQETELLIEIFKAKISKKNARIIDLGTGSGILAIVLKLLYPSSTVMAIDISPAALNVAKKNAKIHQVDIEFKEGNWLEGISESFDVLISNPPYLEQYEIDNNPELSYDPHVALFGGFMGVEKYEQIAANKHLFKHIILEINPLHVQQIQDIFPGCSVHQDIYQTDRAIFLDSSDT